MSIERYRALVERLYVTLGIDAAPGMTQAAHLSIDGIEFHLFHGGLLAPDSVIMHCVFGVLPVASRESILLRLLHTQSRLFGVCAPVFSHDASNDRITLMCRFPLQDDEQARSTLELLQFFSAMAKRWGADHFIER
ncbi:MULTISPECIES: type III secretion chaperone CesT [unclassified Herbaspirillum]|uniref:type III secretion chaperone CesT n=1 Tax=unclassified Herbaspirillum TaxID=2624150 RepID=UPI0011500228|nr:MULTISPECIES: type III secretion chaperone CesT [unclassified Herbaspirillum]MBB5391375.1 hypothetical protein [Herbaspirillum sp. SJZ102]TQK12938.1 hypothetical protein FB599_0345 [Herbaspirillum sp. SJZ130]TQK14942.1 hypothetical protein FB598_0283 [Herbaspirillum sp. SJZ106]TWC67297.1 hypothetical protein FB597_104107 [Herbaspirillum sp. SJZ099]